MTDAIGDVAEQEGGLDSIPGELWGKAVDAFEHRLLLPSHDLGLCRLRFHIVETNPAEASFWKRPRQDWLLKPPFSFRPGVRASKRRLVLTYGRVLLSDPLWMRPDDSRRSWRLPDPKTPH